MSVIYCIISMFHVSPPPIKNLHLWPVNHWRRSCRVQTDKPEDPFLLVYNRRKKNGIYICLYVCVEMMALPGYLYTFVWGVLFFLEDKPTI